MRGGDWREQSMQRVVDATGRVILPLPKSRDQEDNLWVRAPGFLPLCLSLPREASSLVKVTLVRAGEVSGRVVDQLGCPVAGARISAASRRIRRTIFGFALSRRSRDRRPALRARVSTEFPASQARRPAATAGSS